MKTSDFYYSLPAELIAQTPIEPRDRSRLMVLDRSDGSIKHRSFFELVDCLRTGDVLVFNNSRVIPARLRGTKVDTGGRVELLLLRRLEPSTWEALVKPAKRIDAGARIEIANGSAARLLAEVTARGEGSARVITFSDEMLLPKLGEIPLPPYIHTPLARSERYQTVYASVDGSVAAPTAGLHFTAESLNAIKQKGIQCLFVTLHIGLDTFQPVREEDPAAHSIHREYGEVTAEVASQISQARSEGRRIIGVGTTTVRILEQAARSSESGRLGAFEGWVELFILPGYRFQIVDGLITNFHLPCSTLLMLVTAFAGKDLINRAYQEAIAQRYHFYSFGDAMFIL
jgi:S-adenosylmethionine:tRNA ribosyltransferase-isomerase